MEAINPFHSLYITEKISPKEYVGVVSPLLVPHANKLFMSGNVVIQGTQGSGKTTLLALLKPEIREAYISAGKDFPVVCQFSNFISSGINFLKSGILDFGKRPIHKDREYEEYVFPLFFADFFNYYICIDLFETIYALHNSNFKYIDIDLSNEKLLAFTYFIRNEDCWFEYLKDINTFDELKNKFLHRKSIYRNFHQFNIHEIPREIYETKTSIGEPISRIARALKKFEIIPHDTEIFIRIDQIETILDSDKLRPSLGELYRRMLNSTLIKRDPSISYKIGSRTYAWKKELRVYNSNETIEENRSYTLLDVDDMLRRRENSSSYIFPKFARDIFVRRLKYYKLVNEESKGSIFNDIFGKPLNSDEIAKFYCINADPQKALKIPDEISGEIKSFLILICKKDPLEGILATAWCLQGKKEKNYKRFDFDKYDKSTAPWNKPWWRKERIHLALVQLASNCNQGLIWGGSSEILNLGTAGVLYFLGICQHIWDTYLRTLEPEIFETENSENLFLNQGIPISVQTLGIVSASKQWFEKISELSGGHERQRVVENMGRWFANKLRKDTKMSYPGHTGFSLTNVDIQDNHIVKSFLQDATDCGVLFEVSHTSKEPNKISRTKWYFNPIYCPFIKIYEARIKEPYYTNPSFIESFISGEKVKEFIDESIQQNVSIQLTLW
jgi:hypothetical protein